MELLGTVFVWTEVTADATDSVFGGEDKWPFCRMNTYVPKDEATTRRIRTIARLKLLAKVPR